MMKSNTIATVALGLLLPTLYWSHMTPATAATKRIKASQIAQIVNVGLDSAKIHLNNLGNYDGDQKNTWHRKNDSFLKWHGLIQRFDIPSDCYGKRLDGCYYVSNVNSKQIDMAPKGNSFLLRIEFESKGSEIKGMCRWKKLNGDYRECTGNEDRRAPDVNWLHNRLDVTLAPRAHNGGIVFDVKNVDVKGEFQMNGICKIGKDICDRIFGYKKKIENGVESSVKKFLNDKQTHHKMADVTQKGLAKLGLPAVKSLRMDDGDVIVEY
jgi:hypothetical protein